MDSPVRHYLLVLVAALAVILPGAVFASALPVPISITPTAPVPAGLQSVVTFDARGVPAAANNAGYYSRPVLVSNNTLGKLGKGLLRRSAPFLAMTLAIEAAGWAIDELTGQVMHPATGTQPAIGDGVWCVTGWACSATMSGFVGQQLPWTGGTFIVTRVDTVRPGYLEVNNGSVGGDQASFRPYAANDVALGMTPATPVSDADIGQVVANNPALADAALHNADGSVNRNPDVHAAAEALAAELASAAPAPDPVSEWDTGNQGGNPSPAATELEFPVFCTWASVVCEAIDWVRAPEDPLQDIPLPIEDLPVTQSTWVSGLGNGSCPAPRSIGLSVGSFEMSYQAACDLAGFVRPLVIISALMLAAFIVVGAGRQA